MESTSNSTSFEIPTKPVKRTVRTTEKYDSDGKLIYREVITEEEDYYEKPEEVYFVPGTTYIPASNLINYPRTGDYFLHN